MVQKAAKSVVLQGLYDSAVCNAVHGPEYARLAETLKEAFELQKQIEIDEGFALRDILIGKGLWHYDPILDRKPEPVPESSDED